MRKLTSRLAKGGVAGAASAQRSFATFLHLAYVAHDALLYVVGKYRIITTNLHLFVMRSEAAAARRKATNANLSYQRFRKHEDEVVRLLNIRRLELHNEHMAAFDSSTTKHDELLAEAKSLGRNNIYDNR